MSGKRKAVDALALCYSTKLTSVTRALDNIASVDASDELTTGTLDAAPFPGLRLKGDAADLPLPLTPDAIDAITRKPPTKKIDDPTRVIDSQSVELRNSRWTPFVERIVRSVREPLGISDAATVDATLRQLVLVRPGGKLPVDTTKRSSGRKQVPFGTLVVVLPGEFTGGGISICTDSQSDPTSTTAPLQWNPGHTARHTYDISYAAFYNHVSSVTAMPITSGDALCLVYDLVTTTIHEIPRCAGLPSLIDAFETALTQFFEVVPSTKRFKISDDAWRMINEFAVDHRFVYPVTGREFEKLQGSDHRIAERLAAFCAQSGGQYVLYLTDLCCSRKSYSREDDEDAAEANFEVLLEGAWEKHGNRGKMNFPGSPVNHLVELAPAGFLETLEYAHEEEGDDSDDDYGYHEYDDREDAFYKHRQHFCGALVVQPATLEPAMWAKMPIKEAMKRLQELSVASPTEASRFARLMLSNRPTMTNTDAVFAHFLRIVAMLRDAALFHELLRSVRTFEFEGTRLLRAVRQFGWDVCTPTIEHILHTTTFRSRVNLVCSLLHGSTNRRRIHHYVQLVMKLPPWASTAHACPVYVNGNPSVEEMSRLCGLAYRVSPALLSKLIQKPTSQSLTTSLLIPSLIRFAGELPASERAPLSPLLRAFHSRFDAELPTLRNASYAVCRLPMHCVKCDELQAFLTSTDRTITMAVRDKTQLKHIETVIKRKVSYTGILELTYTAPSIVLTKMNMRTARSAEAEQWLASLASLLDGVA